MVGGAVQYPVGPTALAVYALLEAGDDYQTEKIKRALDWLAKTKATKTYELGLRCNVWQIVVKESGGKDANNTPWRNKLTDDAHILEEDLAKDGSYNYDCERKRQCPSGDNSNSQYGVLGMWAAARSISYEVPDQYWWTVMKHWMDCQNVDGGWGYVRNNASSGTMTAAGVATMFVCYDYLYSSSFVACKSVGDFKPIQRGLDYFDRNFANILSGKMAMTTTVGDPFYFLYGIERWAWPADTNISAPPTGTSWARNIC